MNRAQQQQLVQEANMNLIDIRTKELEYFSFFFSNFGTNSLLMAGFMIAALSQQNCGRDSDSNAPYESMVFYWVSCGLCGATGIYTVCGAELTSIFGQNLAINGPPGSMVIALEGMVQEQKHVLFSCLLTAFFFICQCDGMFWFRMDQISATICSIICAIGIFFAHHHLLRIYNRFNWREKEDLDWKRMVSRDMRELRPSLVEDVSSWLFNRPSIDINAFGTDVERNESEIDHETRSVHTVNINMKSVLAHSSMRSSLSELQQSNSMLVGGSISMRTRTRVIGRSVWRRRFLVIKDNHLYFYTNKRSFTLDPHRPLNPRPVNMEGYTLMGGAAQPPYPITLSPFEEEDERKDWQFRCDTIAEFNRWAEAFMVAISLSNEGQDMDQFIRITADNQETKTARGKGASQIEQTNDDDDDDD